MVLHWIRCSIFLLGFFALFANCSVAQNQDIGDENLVQFSGLVMTSDSLQGIPYTNIVVKNRNVGTSSNYKGFFSFVAKEGDTVQFSTIGFQDNQYVIPEDLEDDKYSVIQLMTQDTVYLPETIVNPWPTQEQFKQAFINADIPDDAVERAKKNLREEKLEKINEGMVMDAKENTDYYLRKEAKKYYYAGQEPPMNIFNPFAWAKFIEAWKNGDFKNDDNE